MTWFEKPIGVFDLETTGPDPETDRIVTAAIGIVYPDGRGEHELIVMDPGVEIPEGAARVHGYTTERARREGQDRVAGLQRIHRLLLDLAGRMPIAAFNAAFDFTVTDREFRRTDVAPEGWAPPYVLDPHVIDKQVDRYRKGKRTLTATAEHYGVAMGNAHEADADALAAGLLCYAIARKFPSTPGDIRQVHQTQINWRAEQAASLQDYFRTKGGKPDAVVNGEWPLIAYVPQEESGW